jgi:hypothetical protein
MGRTSLAELAVFEHAGAALAPLTGGLPGPITVAHDPANPQVGRSDGRGRLAVAEMACKRSGPRRSRRVPDVTCRP